MPYKDPEEAKRNRLKNRPAAYARRNAKRATLSPDDPKLVAEREYLKKYRAENREHLRELNAEWRAKNHGRLLAKKRADYAAMPVKPKRSKEKAKEYNKRNYANHRDKRIESQMAYEAKPENKERIKARVARTKPWATPKGKATARAKHNRRPKIPCKRCGILFPIYSSESKYCSQKCLAEAVKNRECDGPIVNCQACGKPFKVSGSAKVCCSSACIIFFTKRRRAEMANVSFSLTEKEWKDIVAYFGSHCAYCHTYLKSPHMDHIHPIARGGSHTADNVAPVCKKCNSSKSARPLLMFLFPAGFPKRKRKQK